MLSWFVGSVIVTSRRSVAVLPLLSVTVRKTGASRWAGPW